MVWTFEMKRGRVCGEKGAGDGGAEGKEARETKEEVDGCSGGG